MKHIIGLIAMLASFVGFATNHIEGAFLCVLFAFILWCSITIEDYKKCKKENKK